MTYTRQMESHNRKNVVQDADDHKFILSSRKSADCLGQKAYRKNSLSWQDLCYSGESLKNYEAKRSDLIKKSLDAVERFPHPQKVDFVSAPFSSDIAVKSESISDEADNNHLSIASVGGDKSINSVGMQYSNNDDSNRQKLIEASLQLFGGYRQDDFQFSIAGDTDGANPNVLSELTWKDLKMTQLKAKGEITVDQRFVLDGMMSYADIYDGEVQDSDYFSDNHADEFSRSVSRADDGSAIDWSYGLGYKFSLGSVSKELLSDDIWFTALGGFSRHELNLIAIDGRQVVGGSGPLPPQLHTSYWAEWEGPWTGFELIGKRKKISALFRFEYHMADYYGSANWNLRDDFQHPKSFEHIADGRGLVLNLGAAYQLNDHWNLNFNADLQDWQAWEGLDRTFFSDGSVIDTQLNQIKWNSTALMFGASCLY